MSVGLFTALAYIGSVRRLSAQSSDLFKEDSKEYAARLIESIENYGDLLYAAKGLYAADAVSARTWHDFIRGQYAFDRYHGLQVLGFARSVEASELPAHTQQIQKELGGRAFEVYPKTEGTNIVMDYIEYKDGRVSVSDTAQGFNLMSEPVRKTAIEQADASGSIVATAPLRLVKSNNMGFLLILPLLVKDKPKAYAISAFDITSLVDKTLKPSLSRYGASVVISDTTDAAPQLLYSMPSPTGGKIVKQNMALQIADRHWRVTFQAPERRLHVTAGRFAPFALLVGGIVITLVIAVGFYSMNVRKKLHRAIASKE